MKFSYFRIFIYILSIVSIFFGLARLYYDLTDDFRLSNITHDMINEVVWHTPYLSDEQQAQVAKALQQKFYYIGKGAQCYAFASEDNQYVLKFFKFKHLRPNWFIRLLPSISPFKAYKDAVNIKKKHKLQGLFEGYELAYREDREDSGLLYLHLVPTSDLKHKISIIDKIGWKWQINLDDVVFLIQRKGETFRTRMHNQLKENQIEKAKESINRILTMYIREYQKGLYDRDHGVMHNTGFVEDHPFHLDVGKLTKNEQMRQIDFYKKDFEHVVWKIDTWIKSNYPQHYVILSLYLAEQYRNQTGEHFDIQLIDPQQFKKKRHLNLL